MTTKNILKYLFIAVVGVIAAFSLADSLGYFNTKPYTAVSHGSHNHYVPHNRDPNVSLDKFPMEEPGPNEVITPTGQIVTKEEWEKRSAQDSL